MFDIFPHGNESNLSFANTNCLTFVVAIEIDDNRNAINAKFIPMFSKALASNPSLISNKVLGTMLTISIK